MATEKEMKEREEAIRAKEEELLARELALKPKAKGEPVPAKYLKGLSYNGAKHEEVFDKKLGKKKMVHTPFERPLAPGDVMDWKDNGEVIVIVAKDGKKHEVNK